MNQLSGLLASFYQRLLHLYPPQFREDYREEMAAVFEMQLAAKGKLTLRQALTTAWRELLPLPGLLIAAYLRERRQSPMKTTLHRWFAQPGPGSWIELALAAVPFLVMGILPGIFSMIPAIMDLPDKYGLTILIFLALVLIALGITGLMTQIPRWSLVYAGVLVALVPLSLMYVSINFWGFSAPFGGTYASAISFYMVLFLVIHFGLTGVLIWLSGKIKLTSGFRRRVESDPGLLALLFYGGAFLIVLLNYDEVDGSYQFIFSSVVMVLGAWGFLKAANLRSKLLALTAGLTTAAIVTLIANLTRSVIPITLIELGPVTIPSPVISVGITWLVALVMILLPPLAVEYSPAAEA